MGLGGAVADSSSLRPIFTKTEALDSVDGLE